MTEHKRLRIVDQLDLPSDISTAVLTAPTLIFCCKRVTKVDKKLNVGQSISSYVI
jgi:hypothetical protein